jgi:hypothetical protein
VAAVQARRERRQLMQEVLIRRRYAGCRRLFAVCEPQIACNVGLGAVGVHREAVKLCELRPYWLALGDVQLDPTAHSLLY